jgi:inner membrane protein
MDSLTQIVLGAAAGEAVLGRKVGNKAILWGAIAGTIPDLDVFVKFFVDELTATEMHRGFSHSIIFSLLFSPVLGWIASRIHKKEGVDWKGWMGLMFASLITHPLLDAHTNWGTTLFWPFEYKVAYNNIFIIDPLYTIPFMVCIIWAMTLKRDNPKRKKINNIGIIISSSYMVFTLLAKGVGYYHFQQSLQKKNITYTRMITNPTPFNCILWSTLVETQDKYYVGYYSLLDGSRDADFFEIDKNHEILGDLKNEDLVKRLIKLSQGWYLVVKEGDKTYVNDMRFGQIGMGDDPDSFVFSHELWYENGVLKVQQRRRKFDKVGDALLTIFRRVAGK